jgi:hypothetical protein
VAAKASNVQRLLASEEITDDGVGIEGKTPGIVAAFLSSQSTAKVSYIHEEAYQNNVIDIW